MDNEERCFDYEIHQPTMPYGFVLIKGTDTASNIYEIQQQFAEKYKDANVKEVDFKSIHEEGVADAREKDGKCRYCGGEMWDNRDNKPSVKHPDYKCKSKSCGAAAWINKDNSLYWREGQ